METYPPLRSVLNSLCMHRNTLTLCPWKHIRHLDQYCSLCMRWNTLTLCPWKHIHHLDQYCSLCMHRNTLTLCPWKHIHHLDQVVQHSLPVETYLPLTSVLYSLCMHCNTLCPWKKITHDLDQCFPFGHALQLSLPAQNILTT